MEKAAMELMLDEIRGAIYLWQNPSMEMDGAHVLNVLKEKATELLETEKKQIVEAFDSGHIAGWIEGSRGKVEQGMMGEEYFNNKFKK